jgi:histidinol phosphatase-like PHP family hydrolase
MIDLHTHTLFSDGELVPMELARRAECAGYRWLAMTDHADASTLESAVRGAVAAAAEAARYWKIRVLPGTELTHNPPQLLPELIREARRMGARVVVVHGETLVEPVPEGTNEMAVAGGADILAHPGLIAAKTARAAARRGVALEISARKGHCLANGHVAAAASAAGAQLLVNSDAHSPGDLISRETAARVARGAGLAERAVRAIFREAERLAERLAARAHGG